MNVKKRLRLAKRHKTFTNCFGTAFYIAGIVKKDEFICQPSKIDSKVKRLEKLEKPELYSLAIFRKRNGNSNYIDHLAIVTGLNPVLITYRGLDGHQWIENILLEEAVQSYKTKLVEYRKIPQAS